MLAELLIGLWPVWNNPYPDEKGSGQVLYSAFSQEAKHLDPALSYSADEWNIINQIYEPLLEYHYLKRPYVLQPLLAQDLPRVYEEHTQGKVVTVYDIHIKPGIYYQPHPAFHQYPNHTREVTAQDFIYQIKRLGDPSLNSPIFGVMRNIIVGLDNFEKHLTSAYAKTKNQNKNLDLRAYDIKGVHFISKYHYQIKIKGRYPQFLYWLAMPFFSPMPWEAVQYYTQPQLKADNITLDYYPVGTGPFMLTENNPNARMVLTKNPYYRAAYYPSEGEQLDVPKGLLKLKNQRIPFLDKVVFTREPETIPYWNKFLQGYYDQSGISSDSFDQALQAANTNSGLDLTPELKAHNIKLNVSVLPSVFYWGFNMLDPVVGGSGESSRQLRQAISIAMDIQEYIDLFLNGRGVVAQSPLPAGVFGFVAQKQAHTLEEAKLLLAQAGYPNGIDPKTKAPLILYLDTMMSSGPDSNAIFAWTRKQFKKLNIDLVIRATQYNRFQEKMRTGNAQIFSWGWVADYPDPENFLFLLYGPNGKVKFQGENAVNYSNTQYDALFEKMKSMPNNVQRQALINEMIDMLKHDAPWVWGYNPFVYTLSHQWLSPTKTMVFGHNTLKYIKIDSALRNHKRQLWNQPKVWPFILMLIAGVLLCAPAIIMYKRKMNNPP